MWCEFIRLNRTQKHGERTFEYFGKNEKKLKKKTFFYIV